MLPVPPSPPPVAAREAATASPAALRSVPSICLSRRCAPRALSGAGGLNAAESDATTCHRGHLRTSSLLVSTGSEVSRCCWWWNRKARMRNVFWSVHVQQRHIVTLDNSCDGISYLIHHRPVIGCVIPLGGRPTANLSVPAIAAPAVSEARPGIFH